VHRPSRVVLLAIAAAAIAACRHVSESPAGLPPDWELLRTAPSPFAALYRVECCGQRGLLATVRAGSGLLRVTVAAPPAGTIADVWLTADAGWLTRNQGRCVTPISNRGVPLREGRWLPLEAVTAELALAGSLPVGALRDESRTGWVRVEVPGFACYRWRVEGSPPVVTAFEVGRTCGEVALAAELSAHHGRVPGLIALRSGRDRAVLELVEWRSAEIPEAPGWLAAPRCDEEP
jgi:hypothetical protein